MTRPGRAKPAWESLTPWEKAAQWHETAPHISEEIMLLARQHAEHQWAMEKAAATHSESMDKRLWLTQIVTISVGFINVLVLGVVAWHYADTGNVVPGLTMFGAGTGLTAGTYFAGRAATAGVRRRLPAVGGQQGP